mmetsp:Transcript_63421/g.196524  ORF Transcript_63421/g.196524 Transcript_63421/m.196524 type:complete len:200 (-) Transcript_63421:407-1006(-)
MSRMPMCLQVLWSPVCASMLPLGRSSPKEPLMRWTVRSKRRVYRALMRLWSAWRSCACVRGTSWKDSRPGTATFLRFSVAPRSLGSMPRSLAAASTLSSLTSTHFVSSSSRSGTAGRASSSSGMSPRCTRPASTCIMESMASWSSPTVCSASQSRWKFLASRLSSPCTGSPPEDIRRWHPSRLSCISRSLSSLSPVSIS